MKYVIRACVGVILAMTASFVFAAFHTFRFQQVYSNADGTVQFMVLTTAFDGESFWTGRSVVSSGSAGTQTFTFPFDLPDSRTAGKRVLIATQGFAALGIVRPDYVIPNNFLSTGAGSINYADVTTVAYSAGQLQTDGVHALYVGGQPAQNLATNYFGQSGSVTAGAPPPAVPNYQGLWWNAPPGSESGWGINFAHQGDVIFATWFTYDINGKAWWLTMTANKTAEGVYSGVLYATTGAPFSAFVPPAAATQVGTGTLTFTSSTTGTFAYVVNGVTQTKTIVPQVFGPLPTCVWGAQADLTKATNFEDLWWATGGTESGWGVNLTQQGTTIFATWFTYDANRKPLWLSATLLQTGPNAFSGQLNLTAGPAFSAVPFDPSKITLTAVGTASFTFTDGNNGTFSYSVDFGDGVNKATQSKAITRQVFRAPGTVCQ